nr:hypothetical protein [Dickeya dadantii]
MADINITLSIPSAGMNGGLGGVGGADNLNSGLGNNGLSGNKSSSQDTKLLEALAIVLTALLSNNGGTQGSGNNPLERSNDAIGGNSAPAVRKTAVWVTIRGWAADNRVRMAWAIF